MEENYIWGFWFIALAVILTYGVPYWNTLTEGVQGWLVVFYLAVGAIFIILGQVKGRRKIKESRAK